MTHLISIPLYIQIGKLGAEESIALIVFQVSINSSAMYSHED